MIKQYHNWYQSWNQIVVLMIVLIIWSKIKNFTFGTWYAKGHIDDYYYHQDLKI